VGKDGKKPLTIFENPVMTEKNIFLIEIEVFLGFQV